MATYTAVASLMHDLEQLASFYYHIFNSEFRAFTKKEIEILYNAVSLMDSLLRDPSGQSYNLEIIDQISEKRIVDVVHNTRSCVDFWAVNFQLKLTWKEWDDRRRELIQEMSSIHEALDKKYGYNIGVISPTEHKLPCRGEESLMMFGAESRKGKKDHIATSNAIFSLTEDLKQCLRSNDHILAMGLSMEYINEVNFTVCRIDGHLRFYSGKSYNFIDQSLEERILDVVDMARTDFGNMLHYFALSLTEIIERIVSINEELMKIRDARKVQDLEVNYSTGKSYTSLSPSRRTPSTEVKLVGLGVEFETMLHNLTGHPLQLKVFSITGMAGIGKTTFSKKLFGDPLVVHHFYVRVWITVSQQYQVRELLLGVLCCVTNDSDEIHRSNEELREQVYRSLKGKRYLIVLDDMWDTKAWDELKRTFPDDMNGSRIMLTSRLKEVAVHASGDTPPLCLRCLSIQESWELLSSKIFVDESCPPELVELGKQIADKCQGLPLALVVVGGLLSKMNRKQDVWEEVAWSVRTLVMEDHCQNILALSYNHLPDHLKTCFLYMGIFPEDYEIPVKKLIWLWVAEGFIRPSELKSVEEVAEDHLEDLIARSLLLVKRKGSDGRIKTCYMHDIVRELCLRESQKLNFLHVINSCGQLPLTNLHDHPLLNFDVRRVSFHSSILKYIHKASVPYACSFVCFEKLSFSHARGTFGMHFRLLKVLDIMSIQLSKIPEDIKNLVLLKFLGLTIEDSSCITYLFAFPSLQTLIFDCAWNGQLPRIFWDLLELRHFHLKRSCLSYSPTYSQSSSTSVLEPVDAKVRLKVLNNLRSLLTVRPISCTKKILLSLPHLKKLGVHETEDDYPFRGWFKNLVHLQELETLKYVFSNPFVSSDLKPDRLPSWDSFPPKLVKLTLSGTSFPWEDMFKLSKLPKLEVLKVRNYAFSGAVWKSWEGSFQCLKFLLIGSTNLEIWEADATHFPNLQHLVLRHCRYLKEIPYGIGEAPLLEKIELHHCNDSAVMSARNLQEEQQSSGNDCLTIYIVEG